MSAAARSGLAFLLCAAMIISVSAPTAADEAWQTPDMQKSVTDLKARIETLVRKYYPKAKITQKPYSIHFEYKVRQYDIPQTYTIEAGPDWSGILGDVELKEGRLSDEDAVEKKLNQYSYYNVIELRPNSSRANCHLATRLGYPFNVQPEFLQSFKALVRQFDSPEQTNVTN
jgi:hypothetical protein